MFMKIIYKEKTTHPEKWCLISPFKLCDLIKGIMERVNMRNLYLILIAVFFFSLLSSFPVMSRPNLKDLDKPMLLDAGPSKRMYVIFNHSSHKKVKCRNCHHEGLPGNRYAACTSPECHAITDPSSREPLSVYMAYHAPGMQRSCFGCHKPLAGKYPDFKGCRPCHKPGQMLKNGTQSEK